MIDKLEHVISDISDTPPSEMSDESAAGETSRLANFCKTPLEEAIALVAGRFDGVPLTSASQAPGFGSGSTYF